MSDEMQKYLEHNIESLLIVNKKSKLFPSTD